MQFQIIRYYTFKLKWKVCLYFSCKHGIDCYTRENRFWHTNRHVDDNAQKIEKWTICPHKASSLNSLVVFIRAFQPQLSLQTEPLRKRYGLVLRFHTLQITPILMTVLWNYKPPVTFAKSQNNSSRLLLHYINNTAHKTRKKLKRREPTSQKSRRNNESLSSCCSLASSSGAGKYLVRTVIAAGHGLFISVTR